MSTTLTIRSRNVRLHGKIPRVDHIEQTYPYKVREGITARVKTFPFFQGFHFSSNKALQIQPKNIPFCGIYLLQETLASDGDANAGEIRFRTIVRYGFSVIIQNNDNVEAEKKLDKALQSIQIGLFTDPTFYNNKTFRLQGFTSGSRTHVYGSIGLDNELPIAELRYELTCDLGVIDYQPVVPDMLEVVHIKTAYPSIEKKDTSFQVEAEYDIDQPGHED
jgi:hypothetical protein